MSTKLNSVLLFCANTGDMFDDDLHAVQRSFKFLTLRADSTCRRHAKRTKRTSYTLGKALFQFARLDKFDFRV